MKFLYPGAIHIHTTYSDGTGTVEEIAKAAKKAGLSWIIITDHNNLKAKPKEGIYDGVCVIVATEISPEKENHYIALDTKENISCNMPASEFVQRVKKQGGFGFIAHPDGKISRKNSFRSLRWEDWSIKDFGGLEIWNYMSNWADHYNEKNPLKIVYQYLFRNRVLSGPTKNVLNWWDELNNENEAIIPAIGGLDVHSFDITRFFVTVKIFPYESMFKSLTNFICLEQKLPPDFESQKKVIQDAVKSGHNIIMNRFGHKNYKTVFYIENDSKQAYPGDIINLDNATNLKIRLPKKGQIRIVLNGETIIEKYAKKFEHKIDKVGKYRIEVYDKKTPWIFSNPINVLSCK